MDTFLTIPLAAPKPRDPHLLGVFNSSAQFHRWYLLMMFCQVSPNSPSPASPGTTLSKILSLAKTLYHHPSPTTAATVLNSERAVFRTPVSIPPSHLVSPTSAASLTSSYAYSSSAALSPITASSASLADSISHLLNLASDLITVQDSTPMKVYFRNHITPAHVEAIVALSTTFTARIVAPGTAVYLPKKPTTNSFTFSAPEPSLYKAHVSLGEAVGRGTSSDYGAMRGPGAPYGAKAEQIYLPETEEGVVEIFSAIISALPSPFPINLEPAQLALLLPLVGNRAHALPPKSLPAFKVQFELIFQGFIKNTARLFANHADYSSTAPYPSSPQQYMCPALDANHCRLFATIFTCFDRPQQLKQLLALVRAVRVPTHGATQPSDCLHSFALGRFFRLFATLLDLYRYPGYCTIMKNRQTANAAAHAVVPLYDPATFKLPDRLSQDPSSAAFLKRHCPVEFNFPFSLSSADVKGSIDTGMAFNAEEKTLFTTAFAFCSKLFVHGKSSARFDNSYLLDASWLCASAACIDPVHKLSSSVDELLYLRQCIYDFETSIKAIGSGEVFESGPKPANKKLYQQLLKLSVGKLSSLSKGRDSDNGAALSARLGMLSTHATQITASLLYNACNFPRAYKKRGGAGAGEESESDDSEDGEERRHRASTSSSAPGGDNEVEAEDHNLDWYYDVIGSGAICENAVGTFHPDENDEDDTVMILPDTPDAIEIGLNLLSVQLDAVNQSVAHFNAQWGEQVASVLTKKDNENFRSELAAALVAADAGVVSEPPAPGDTSLGAHDGPLHKMHLSAARSSAVFQAAEITDPSSEKTLTNSIHEWCFKGASSGLDDTALEARNTNAFSGARRIEGRIIGFRSTLSTATGERTYLETYLKRAGYEWELMANDALLSFAYGGVNCTSQRSKTYDQVSPFPSPPPPPPLSPLTPPTRSQIAKAADEPLKVCKASVLQARRNVLITTQALIPITNYLRTVMSKHRHTHGHDSPLSTDLAKQFDEAVKRTLVTTTKLSSSSFFSELTSRAVASCIEDLVVPYPLASTPASPFCDFAGGDEEMPAADAASPDAHSYFEKDEIEYLFSCLDNTNAMATIEHAISAFADANDPPKKPSVAANKTIVARNKLCNEAVQCLLSRIERNRDAPDELHLRYDMASSSKIDSGHQFALTFPFSFGCVSAAVVRAAQSADDEENDLDKKADTKTSSRLLHGILMTVSDSNGEELNSEFKKWSTDCTTRGPYDTHLSVQELLTEQHLPDLALLVSGITLKHVSDENKLAIAEILIYIASMDCVSIYSIGALAALPEQIAQAFQSLSEESLMLLLSEEVCGNTQLGCLLCELLMKVLDPQRIQANKATRKFCRTMFDAIFAGMDSWLSKDLDLENSLRNLVNLFCFLCVNLDCLGDAISKLLAKGGGSEEFSEVVTVKRAKVLQGLLNIACGASPHVEEMSLSGVAPMEIERSASVCEDGAATQESDMASGGEEGRLEAAVANPHFDPNHNLCTYITGKGQFDEQHWYNCFSCDLHWDKGCCSLCVRVCHKGHDVSYSRYSSFFCDCGAQVHHNCSCLKPLSASRLKTAYQTPKTLVARRAPSVDEDEEDEELPLTIQDGARGREQFKELLKVSEATARKLAVTAGKDDWLERICELFMAFYKRAVDKKEGEKDDVRIRGCSAGSVEELGGVSSEARVVLNTESLRSGKAAGKIAACKEGTMTPVVATRADCLKINGSETSPSIDRKSKELIKKYDLQKRLVCVDSKGRQVTAETNKLTFSSAAPIIQGLRHLPSGERANERVDRYHMRVTGQRDLTMNPIGVRLNDFNERHLAVWSPSTLQVMFLNETCTAVTRLIPINLEIDNTDDECIINVEWIPDCETAFAVTTTTGVKLYDLTSEHLVNELGEALPLVFHILSFESSCVKASALLPPGAGTRANLDSDSDSCEDGDDQMDVDNICVLVDEGHTWLATAMLLTDDGMLLSVPLLKPDRRDYEDECER